MSKTMDKSITHMVSGDINWLRGVTTARTSFTADNPEGDVLLDHIAYFYIEPGSVPDLSTNYESGWFSPSFMTAEWISGVLRRVELSGPSRIKSGKLSDKSNRNRILMPISIDAMVDKSDLPVTVADALTVYEENLRHHRN